MHVSLKVVPDIVQNLNKLSFHTVLVMATAGLGVY